MNKVTLIGNTGKEVVIKATKSGRSVANVSLAVQQYGIDTTEWFDLELWGDAGSKRLAFFGDLPKGSRLFVEGSIKTRNWTTPEGQRRDAFSIVVSSFEVLKYGGQTPAKSATETAVEPASAGPNATPATDELPF